MREQQTLLETISELTWISILDFKHLSVAFELTYQWLGWVYFVTEMWLGEKCWEKCRKDKCIRGLFLRQNRVRKTATLTNLANILDRTILKIALDSANSLMRKLKTPTELFFCYQVSQEHFKSQWVPMTLKHLTTLDWQHNPYLETFRTQLSSRASK